MIHGRRLGVVVGLLCAVTIASTIVAGLEVRRSDRLERRAAVLDEFCRATAMSIRQDRRAFESGSAREREAALARFYVGATMHHDATSIFMCTTLEGGFPSTCWLDKDWTCMAEFAGRVERSIR